MCLHVLSALLIVPLREMPEDYSYAASDFGEKLAKSAWRQEGTLWVCLDIFVLPILVIIYHLCCYILWLWQLGIYNSIFGVCLSQMWFWFQAAITVIQQTVSTQCGSSICRLTSALCHSGFAFFLSIIFKQCNNFKQKFNRIYICLYITATICAVSKVRLTVSWKDGTRNLILAILVFVRNHVLAAVSKTVFTQAEVRQGMLEDIRLKLCVSFKPLWSVLNNSWRIEADFIRMHLIKIKVWLLQAGGNQKFWKMTICSWNGRDN